MKIIIFGATGTIGRHLVDQALLHGYEVSAFARRPEALDIDHPRLKRIAGDVLDPLSVSDAVKGHDAVLIALGAGRKGIVRATGTKHIIAAMEQHEVRRLVCQTTLGAGDSRETLNFFWKHIMFGVLLKDALADHEIQETLVKESGLDWILVRPSAFTDGPANAACKAGFPSTEKDLTFKIPRATVANFMLQQLSDDNYLHQTPGLSR